MTDQVIKVLREAKAPLSNKQIRAALGLKVTDYSRDLDRTLQTLRKEGTLVVEGMKWSLAATRPCPTCRGKGRVSA